MWKVRGMPMRCWAPLLGLWLWLSPGVPAIQARGLTAAADETAVWVLSPKPDRPEVFTVLHHAYADPAMLVEHVEALRGEVRPHCVGARDHTLWIVYPDGEVQTIRAEPSVLEDGWVYRARVEPNMPTGVAVRAMALTRDGPWALVRIEDAQTLQRLDTLGTPAGTPTRDVSAKRLRNIAIGLPPGYGIDKEPNDADNKERSGEDTDSEADAGSASRDQADKDVSTSPKPDDAAVKLPVDRLIYLKHGVWKVMPLPADWPHGAEAWLVAENPQAEYPTLVGLSSRSRSQAPVSVDVYRVDDEADVVWRRETYLLGPSSEVGGLTFIGVEGQLVAARSHVENGRIDAELSVLRGGKELAAGTMTLQGVSPTDWSLLGTGTTATLLAQVPYEPASDKTDAERLRFRWTRMDVRGQTILEPADLSLKTRSPMDDLTQYIMLAFIAVLVTVLMLAFWRRDASWNRLELPPNLIVADLGRRAFAAAVDMAPGLLGSMAWFGLSSQELMLRWPGNGVAHTFDQVLPGTIVIAVFVLHTTISELFFARTLGKAMTGLRTTALDGTRPKTWQLLVRGLLKALDLIPGAWLLLMLPVIAPHRQRLGDLVGRTVVVCDAPPVSDDTDVNGDTD